MASFGTEPDWATPGDTSAAPTPAPAPNAAAPAAAPTSEIGGSIKFILVCVSVVNFCIAGMMGTLGVLTLINFELTNLQDIAATPFLATYMILFAALLFVYELIWWVPIPHINRTLRKNFGFMYGLQGKGFYLIFVAFLCIGLLDEKNKTIEILGWATGIAFLAVGVLHIFLILSNSDFVDAYKPPTAGLERMSSNNNENVV